jgi:hypothetical protein
MIVADHVTLTVRVDARRVCCRYRAAQSRQLASVAQPSAERSPLSHIGIRAKISWAMIAPIDQTTYLNVIPLEDGHGATLRVWQIPQREFERRTTIPPCSRWSWAIALPRITSMTDPNDDRFPYVLLCSTLGTIVSFASVWIETYHAFVPVVGAKQSSLTRGCSP